MKDNTHLFTLRIKAGPSVNRNISGRDMIIIHAYEGRMRDPSPNHNRIDIEVRQGGKAVFTRESELLYCGLPAQYSTDGIHAKELVLALVGMKPGDTDSEYFACYSPGQLAWATRYGEELDMVRQFRYCDPEGNVVEPKGRRLRDKNGDVR